jgi:hypothetical protein
VLDRYVFEERTELIDNPCEKCQDIWETQGRQKVRKTRIVNIYNRALRETCIDFRELMQGRTILAGDFNCRSAVWDSGVRDRHHNASTAQGLIEDHALIINNDDQPTRCGPTSRSPTELTLSTPSVGTLQTWGIDEDLATPSDDAVIVFSWAPWCSSDRPGLQTHVELERQRTLCGQGAT